jgi:hypothetical protein
MAGDFTKQQSGGGKQGKSMYSCHFAAGDQCHDELGLSRDNPAVVDCSAPILTVERSHRSDHKHGEGTTITWNQYWLLDAKQIRKIKDAKDDPEVMACYDSRKRATGLSLTEPNTPGNWGDWIVGGEVLQCPEVWRSTGTKCSFSFEKLRDVENRLQEAVKHDPWRSGYTRQYREWRQLDYENIVIQSPKMSKWIDEFPLRQATSLKAFPPPVQVDSMDFFHQ